jgi:AcrR family transcriptional regulator
MRQIAQRPDIRDLILDGVDVLLSRHGYRKMTMDDLAKNVGIGKGTIYLHFPSKQELTLSHISRIVDRLLQKLRSIVASSQTFEERLEQMLMERVLFRFDSVQHYRESINEILSDLRPVLLARRQEYFEKEAAVFADLLRKGTRAGAFVCADPHTTAWVLITATNALLPYSLSVSELGSRKQTESRVKQLSSVLIRGLKAGTPQIIRRLSK